MNEQQKARLNKIVEQVRGAKILDATQAGFRGDGYTNLLNKYGTAQDNSTAYYYEKDNIVIDIELTSLYESNGIFAKIIDRPSEESLKHGLDIDFGDETISEYVEERLDDLDFEDKFATAEKWARLYGGAIIVMLCDDGGALEEPLDWDKVTTIEELRVFDRSVVQEDFTGYFRFNVFGATGKPIPQEEPMYYRVNSTHQDVWYLEMEGFPKKAQVPYLKTGECLSISGFEKHLGSVLPPMLMEQNFLKGRFRLYTKCKTLQTFLAPKRERRRCFRDCR